MVCSCEQAVHSGGCGFCLGLGSTLRGGKSKYSPEYEWFCLVNIGTRQRTASSKIARFSANSTLNGSSSVSEALSPMPNSTRPLEIRSSAETCAASLAGWLVVRCRMPWARRICLVRWLAAPRKMPGAEECEYSSRKWCSTSQA
jgi:hypothetical protein